MDDQWSLADYHRVIAEAQMSSPIDEAKRLRYNLALNLSRSELREAKKQSDEIKSKLPSWPYR